WNTGWFDFKTEWPGVVLREDKTSAVSVMLLRFLDAFVFATLDQIRSWSQLNRKTTQSALDLMVERGQIVKREIEDLGTGFMRKEDVNLGNGVITPSVFMLDKSDFLVRASMDELKENFKGRE